MSLDEELRSTFDLAAERCTAPPSDVVGLIHAGRARRRRRTLTRAAATVAASMAVGAATLGLVTSDLRVDGDVVSPPRPSPTTELDTPSDDRAALPPRTYRKFVGRDPSGARVEVDVTVDGSYWKENDFPLVSDRSETTHAGVGVYQPVALAAGSGCETDPTTGPVATTAGGLVAQLIELPRSTVLSGPSTTRVGGRPALHLRLRIDVDCPGYYRVAEAVNGTRGITYAPLGVPAPNVVIDFWVLSVDGAVIVIDEWHDVEAPRSVVAQARAARRSITLVDRR